MSSRLQLSIYALSDEVKHEILVQFADRTSKKFKEIFNETGYKCIECLQSLDSSPLARGFARSKAEAQANATRFSLDILMQRGEENCKLISEIVDEVTLTNNFDQEPVGDSGLWDDSLNLSKIAEARGDDTRDNNSTFISLVIEELSNQSPVRGKRRSVLDDYDEGEDQFNPNILLRGPSERNKGSPLETSDISIPEEHSGRGRSSLKESILHGFNPFHTLHGTRKLAYAAPIKESTLIRASYDENIDFRLHELLNELDLLEYAEKFRQEKIKYSDLQFLTRQDLRDTLQLPLGPLSRLWNYIHRMQGSNGKSTIDRRSCSPRVESPRTERKPSTTSQKLITLQSPRGTINEVPDHFLCPILQEVMKEPVMTADGHTYERWAIENWLEKHKSSPATGLKLEDTKLRTNYALKRAIDTFFANSANNSLIQKPYVRPHSYKEGEEEEDDKNLVMKNVLIRDTDGHSQRRTSSQSEIEPRRRILVDRITQESTLVAPISNLKRKLIPSNKKEPSGSSSVKKPQQYTQRSHWTGSFVERSITKDLECWDQFRNIKTKGVAVEIGGGKLRPTTKGPGHRRNKSASLSGDYKESASNAELIEGIASTKATEDGNSSESDRNSQDILKSHITHLAKKLPRSLTTEIPSRNSGSISLEFKQGKLKGLLHEKTKKEYKKTKILKAVNHVVDYQTKVLIDIMFSLEKKAFVLRENLV